MEGSFMIMTGIVVCLLIAVFWLVLIGFGIYWIVEYKREIKERKKIARMHKQLRENIKRWSEKDMENFKIVNK